MVECILEAKKWPKSIPAITEEEVAIKVADILVHAGYFHRSEKMKDKKGYLQVYPLYTMQILCGNPIFSIDFERQLF